MERLMQFLNELIWKGPKLAWDCEKQGRRTKKKLLALQKAQEEALAKAFA
jgi:hypothetical protein